MTLAIFRIFLSDDEIESFLSPSAEARLNVSSEINQPQAAPRVEDQEQTANELDFQEMESYQVQEGEVSGSSEDDIQPDTDFGVQDVQDTGSSGGVEDQEQTANGLEAQVQEIEDSGRLEDDIQAATQLDLKDIQDIEPYQIQENKYSRRLEDNIQATTELDVQDIQQIGYF